MINRDQSQGLRVQYVGSSVIDVMRKVLRNQRLLWIVLLAGVISSGCVYYNTFFNARQAFNEAEKYRKQTGQGTQVGYKTAIDKSLKVVEEHANSKYYDDALFVLGVSYYYTQQYNKADRRLRELLTDFPKSKFVKEGTLYLAKAKLKIGEIDAANTLFEEIVQGKYEKEYRAEAAMALGEYHSEQKDQANALRYYMAVRDSLGDEKQRLQAQRFIADDYFDEFKFGDALKGYLQVLGLKPDHAQKYHALYQAAVCSYRMQRIGVGLDYLSKLSKDPLFFDSLGAITLAVGEGHEAAGDIELAESVYQDVAMTSKNPNWVGEAYYRIGLIYQFDYDDVDKAKTFYDKSSQSSGGTLSGQDARSRSTDIGRLQALTKAGLDTAAVRMAQEGLDSLPPEDSVDIILEMKLPPPKDTTSGKDTLSAKTPTAGKDSTIAGNHIGADTLKVKDSTGTVKKDTTAIAGPIKAPSPKDSTKVFDTTQTKLPAIAKDSLGKPGTAAMDSQKTRDSSSAANRGLNSPPKDSVKVSDTALVKIPVKVGVPSPPSDSAAADTLTSKTAAQAASKDSTGVKPVDTTNTKGGAVPSVKPPIQIESSAQKILDSLAKVKADSAAAAGSLSKNFSPATGPIPGSNAAAAKGNDSLSRKDSLALRATDSLLAHDSTGLLTKDSLASNQAKDSTGAKNGSKVAHGAAPKPSKDTVLTRAQIFKRINDAAESQYSLAELYWFQLDKPDSAIKELTELLRVFPKSDRAPEAVIALSQMYRDYRADSTGADSLLHTVLTNYPHSDYVPVALEALGLKGTAADTGYADYYIRRAESFLFDQKNPDSARYYYRYVARQFPRSHLRDQAAFSAVWVVENYKSPGDSSIYYAYKQLSNAFPGSLYATEAAKRLTFTPPPPIKKPGSDKEKKPMTHADSLLAQGNNLVATAQSGTLDTTGGYIDPRKAAFVGPKKEDLIIIDLQPVQTRVDFTYPTEAYDLEGNQFELYFQVLLDVTGRVIDLTLKIPSSSDELNRRAQLTVASMTFDPLEVSKQLQQKAINLILPEEQTDPRGRWYVFKYVIAKPGYLNK